MRTFQRHALSPPRLKQAETLKRAFPGLSLPTDTDCVPANDHEIMILVQFGSPKATPKRRSQFIFVLAPDKNDPVAASCYLARYFAAGWKPLFVDSTRMPHRYMRDGRYPWEILLEAYNLREQQIEQKHRWRIEALFELFDFVEQPKLRERPTLACVSS